MTIGYVSTRAVDPPVDSLLRFGEVLRSGLAPDGGLYCPDEVPPLPDLESVTGYAEVARRVMWPYVEGSIEADHFAAIVADAYGGFRHPDVCPVHDLGDGLHLLDLTLGPTLAFKDVGARFMAHLMTSRCRSLNPPIDLFSVNGVMFASIINTLV